MTHFPCKAAKLFLLSTASAIMVAGFAHATEFVPDTFDGSPAAQADFFSSVLNEEYVPDTFDGSPAAQADFFTSVLEEEFVPDTFDGGAEDYVPDTFDGADYAFDGAEEDDDYVPDTFDGSPEAQNNGDFFADVFGTEDYVPDTFGMVEEIPEESLPEGAEMADSHGAMAVGVVKTTGSDLRMREGPSSDTGVVTSLDKNCTLEVLEYSTEDWYKVSYNGMSGYVSAAYLSELQGTFSASAKVNADGVVVREAPNDDADVRNTIEKGALVTCTALENGWYAVKCQYGTEGYIRSDYLTMTSVSSSSSSSVQLYSTSKSSKGSSVVAVAKRYLNVTYRYGGATPRAFDCSGFTMYVYRQFGYNFAHSASAQWNSGKGKKVYSRSALQAGDLVFFNDPKHNRGKSCSHVGIYIGNGQFIHASSGSGRVVISKLSDSYYKTYFKGGLHVM